MCANSVIPNKYANDNSLVAILHFRQTSNHSRFRMFCLSCSPVLSIHTKDVTVVSNNHICQFSNGSGCDHLPRFLFQCCYAHSLTIITQFANAWKTTTCLFQCCYAHSLTIITQFANAWKTTTCSNLSIYRHTRTSVDMHLSA